MDNLARKYSYNYVSETNSYPARQHVRAHHVFVLACVLAGLVGFSFISKQVTIMKLNSQLYALGEENRLLAQEVEELKIRIQQAESVRNVEELAKTKLGMVFPGEERVIIHVVQEEPPRGAHKSYVQGLIEDILSLMHRIAAAAV